MNQRIFMHSSEVTAEILSMGNELLIGRTVNTNATWICRELVKLGVLPVRGVTFRDVKEEAIRVIRESIQRNPHFIFITGGLGPTFDDIQLECVAAAADLALEINSTALKWIETFYKERGYELNPAREKMALLPKGSKPLFNSVGAAPGCLLSINETSIVCLPGVPSEMKAIMSEEVIPTIREEMKARGLNFFTYGFYIKGVPESEISAVLTKLVKKYPYANFKTHPKGSEGNPILDFNIYGFTTDPTLIAQITREVKLFLRKSFPNADIGPIRVVNEEDPEVENI